MEDKHVRPVLTLPCKRCLLYVFSTVLGATATVASKPLVCERCLPTSSNLAALPAATAATTPQKPILKACVTLLGANDNNDAASFAASLTQSLPLVLIVKEPPAGYPHGELRIYPFLSKGEQPPSIANAKIRTNEANSATDTSIQVALDKPGQTAFSLQFDRLRPGKTYMGQVFITSVGLLHHWDVTLMTEGRGILAVDPIGTLKFVRSPSPHSLSFTLYDKSDGGPYHHVGVRFEPSAPANSKSLTSNFTLDTLSFWENDQRIDIERRDGAAKGTTGAAITLTKLQTLTARVKSLSPGEYSGTLHFSADETSEDSADAKLPLLIQVRDPWAFPVFVIVVGSIFGWFSSKYVVGARRARDLSQQLGELRSRVDSLARRSSPAAGWEFPSEAVSLGFSRLGVELNRLAKLARSAMEVVLHGVEIEEGRKQAERRLLGLESLQETRLRVQPYAQDRPAAQLAIGRRLRRATDLLDRPTFAESEQADLKKLLEELEAWAKKDSFITVYQQALVERLRSNECPNLQYVQSLPAERPIRSRLEFLMKSLPTEEQIIGQTGTAELKNFDQSITRIILLWRERARGWSDEIAAKDAAGGTLDDLFTEIDINIWNTLKTAPREQLVLEPGWSSQSTVQTYEAVEINLGSHIPDLDVWRIRQHPLRIGWSIRPPRGDVRTTRTDALTLVQYFPAAGRVEVAAMLRWKGDQILVARPFSFEVAKNPEYGKHFRLAKEWTEYAAIGVAALFAIATAMAIQYDSTFGSFAQYLAMFVWAAGAGTGGNLFSQLGTSSAPGGAAATLK